MSINIKGIGRGAPGTQWVPALSSPLPFLILQPRARGMILPEPGPGRARMDPVRGGEVQDS